MAQQMSALFFILLVLKSFSQTITTQHHFSNYDITETLRNSIHGIFRNVDDRVKPQKNSIRMCILKLENNIFFFNESYGIIDSFSKKNLYSNFINNEMRLTIKGCSRYGEGTLKSPQDLENADEITYLYCDPLENVSIEVSKSSKNNSNEKFSIHHSVSKDGWLHMFSRHGTTKSDEKKQLKKLLQPIMLQQMRHELVEFGKDIQKELQYNTRTIFTSTHPNFFDDPQQYYYLLPNISYICFNLRNITIRGLTNFESIKETSELIDDFETILLIKNVSGNMILDYGSEIEKPMKLSFLADDVFIRANRSNNCSNVEIRNYRVIRTGLNVSLTDQQSAIIIQYIESAIALSLMPSMTIHRTDDQSSKVYNMQCPLGKMVNEMVNEENWNSIKKVLNKWIPFPFDDDQVTTTNTVPSLITSKNKTDPYEYHISFQNVTIKLISGNFNRKDIQCEFSNNLKIIHQINAAPEQKFHCNSRGEGVDLTFHANFTSIRFSQINTNSSSSNTSCEFQLSSDENTKVELISDKNTNGNESLISKKKIDTTLVSVAKKPFIRNFKQLVCLPFKICSQTVKMIDDFFLHFIDEVLNKCSLRRCKKNDK